MKKLLVFAAVSEGSLGLILLVYPPIVVRLLFGVEIAGPGVWISRFASIALVGLAVACWPDGNPVRAFYGMSLYSTLAMLYLATTASTVGWGSCCGQPLRSHSSVSPPRSSVEERRKNVGSQSLRPSCWTSGISKGLNLGECQIGDSPLRSRQTNGKDNSFYCVCFAAAFLLPFSAQKSHVKSRNHLTASNKGE
jgi:hypothetical protein